MTSIDAFLYHEARLLDEARFEDWLALFDPDGFYWIAARPDQTDPIEHASILYEDPTVMRMRIARLRNPQAYALAPFPRTVHMVGNILVAEPGETPLVKSTLLVSEYRAGEHIHRAALVTHRLRRAGEGWRIALKRVDLNDAESPPGLIQVPL